MNIDLLTRVELAEGANDKIALLKQADELTQQFLRQALDPYINFGVTVTEGDYGGADADITSGAELIFGQVTNRNSAIMDEPNWPRYALHLLGDLQLRYITGNAALTEIRNVMDSAPSPAHVSWLCRVINKDLRCGVGARTLLKALPGIVRQFRIAFAHPYKGQDLNHPCIFEPKLDGERALFVDGVVLSREGFEMPGAKHMIDALNTYFGPSLVRDYVLDAEACRLGWELNQIHSCMAKLQPGSEQLVFNVFDIIPRQEWEVQKSTQTLLERRRVLHQVFKGRYNARFNVVPFYRYAGADIELALRYRDKFRAEGYEGAMFKRLDAVYSFKRTDDIIKFKLFETVEGKIINYYPGDPGTKYEGCLGGFVLELETGVQTNCGGGYSDAQRLQFWEDRDKMIGMFLEGKAQAGRTKNQKLRHMSFIRLRPDRTGW